MAQISQIISDARAFVAQKQAEFKKQALAGTEPGSIPGSEHDKPVDAAAKKSQPEVKDGLPPGSTEATGAKPCETLESGHALDVTQPAGESVAKKPMVTADSLTAEPKSGSAKMANDLLSGIKAYQEQTRKKAEETAKSKAEAATPAGAEAGKEKKVAVEGKPAEGVPSDKSEKGVNAEGTKGAAAVEPAKTASAVTPAPAAAPAAPATKAAAPASPEGDFELTQDLLAKIASCILATQDGWELAQQALVKAAGAETARETMDYIQKKAAYEQGQIDAQILAERYAAMQKQASDEYAQGAADADALIAAMAKRAMAPAAALASNALSKSAMDRLTKLGQAVADEAMAGAGADAGAVPGAEAAMGAMGGAPEGAEGAPGAEGGEDITIEDLAQALEALVQEGTVKPEEAQQILQYVTQGEEAGAGVPAEGGMPPAAAGAEGAGAPTPAPEAGGEKPAADKGEKKDEGEKKDKGEDKTAADLRLKAGELRTKLAAALQPKPAAK